MIYINYNLLLIIISLIISISLLNKKYQDNKIRKIIYLILYIVLPISSYSIYYLIKGQKNHLLVIIPSILYINSSYFNVFINSNYKNIVGFIILLINGFLLHKNNDNKKRNIIIIFLLFIYLFYYFILP